MSHTQLELRDRFIDMFFKGDMLQRVLACFSNSCSAQYVDPITSTCEIMLKNPLQVYLNTHGIVPFKSHPTMVYPFASMTAQQHRFLNEIQLEENRENVSTHELMGGGRLILFFESVAPVYVSHADILVGICQATLAHPKWSGTKTHCMQYHHAETGCPGKHFKLDPEASERTSSRSNH